MSAFTRNQGSSQGSNQSSKQSSKQIPDQPASQMSKQPQKQVSRAQVSPHQTWDLRDLFESDAAWQKAFESLPTEEQLEAEIDRLYRNKLALGAHTVHAALTFRDTLTRKLTNLHTYAGLRNAEDVGNRETSAMAAKADTKYAELMTPFAFLEPELLTLESLTEWITLSPLSEHAFELSELVRSKEHILSDKEEAILTELSPSLGKFSEIHSKWINVDLKYPPAVDAKGGEHLLTDGRYATLLASPDRVLRKSTFENTFGELAKWRNTIAANFYARLITGSTLARIRHYDGFLASQLDYDDIPLAVYDGLISTVRSRLPLLHRSIALRKKVLKIDKVALFDRYVSLSSQTPLVFSWAEACDLVLESLAPLGADYVAAARAGLTTERWADWAENEGKRSGAFSWGTYDSRPYMLITWTGSLNDLFTLAHELGHSMHTWYANRTQPYQTAQYPIFLAEVASTLNEALLASYILKHKANSPLARDVVSHMLHGFEGTVLRQSLFAAFEREASRRVDQGEPLTAGDLDNIYLALNREWYGPDAEIPNTVAHEWMRVPHFYSTFYVYKYATSYCASLFLAEELARDPLNACAQIHTFLKAGGSNTPLRTLKASGVDFLTPKPVDEAFAFYEKNLGQAETLFS